MAAILARSQAAPSAPAGDVITVATARVIEPMQRNRTGIDCHFIRNAARKLPMECVSPVSHLKYWPPAQPR